MLADESLAHGRDTRAARCPNCGRAVEPSVPVCPNCFGSLRAVCEHCGRALEVHPRRRRAGGALRLAMELSGAGIFVFTMGSVLGPILGLGLIAAAQLFGYQTLPHYHCPQCRTWARASNGALRGS